MCQVYSQIEAVSRIHLRKGAEMVVQNHQTGSPITVVHYYSSWLPRTMPWLYNLIRFLPSEVNNHIVCRKTENLEQYQLPGIEVGSLAESVIKNKAQIIHSHFGNEGWRNITTVKETGVKHVVSFYGLDVNRLPTINPKWKIRYQRMFDTVDAVLCEGEHMAQCIINMGCPHEKVHVYHLGVDINRYVFQPRKWDSSQTLKVLISAGFKEKKGIPYALLAIARLKRRRYISDIQVSIIGYANPSKQRMVEEKERIMRIIEEHNLSENVRLLGYQKHDVLMEEAYKHHLFISPSVTAKDGDTEGGAPVTILEMAATGMPIVSTTHCDIPGVLGATNRSLLVEERDVRALSKEILQILSMSSWDAMVTENRRHIEQYFSASTQGKVLADIYRKLL